MFPIKISLYCVPTPVSTETAQKRTAKREKRKKEKKLTMSQPDRASIEANDGSTRYLGIHFLDKKMPLK